VDGEAPGVKAARALPLLVPMLLAGQVSIDHVTVAGSELKTMQAALAQTGIVAEYGGPHANGVTEMALVSFSDGSYLELIAPRAGAGVEAHQWGAAMRGNAGPCAWAARVRDLQAELRRLRVAGVETGTVEAGGRTRPDGKRLQWETASVGSGPGGMWFPFLIRDITPRTLRAWPSGKPSSRDFGSVTRVVIAVRSLDDAIKRYHQAYGVPPPIKQVDAAFGAQMALLGGVPVILAAPLPGSWLAERLDRFGEGPCAFILGARRPGAYKPAVKARWFGMDISWFDPEKLGWRLGFEPVF
jgi:hypothetical protein